MPELGLGELALRDLAERELDGVIAVDVGVLTWTTGHGPASITVTGVTLADLRVEHLGHSELLADDAFHFARA